MPWSSVKDGNREQGRDKVVERIKEPESISGNTFGRTQLKDRTDIGANIAFEISSEKHGAQYDFTVSSLALDVAVEIARNVGNRALSDRAMDETRAHEAKHLMAYMNVLDEASQFISKADAAIDKAGDPDGSRHKKFVDFANDVMPVWIKLRIAIEEIEQIAHIDHLDEHPAKDIDADGNKVRLPQSYKDLLNNPARVQHFIKMIDERFAQLDNNPNAMQLNGTGPIIDNRNVGR